MVNIFVFSLCLVYCIPVLTTGDTIKPWEPKQGNANWLKTHESLIKKTKEYGNETKVVFIGASICHHWQTYGKDIWDSYYVNRSAQNYGVSGDTTSNVLWRLKNHELDGLKPSVIVLQIGYNDFHAYNPQPSAEELAKGVLEVVKQLTVKCPKSKVINIGLTPVKDKKLRVKVKQVNEILAKSADHKRVYFVDIGPNMVDSKGNEKPGLFNSDGIHPTLAGYKIWQKTMKPLFEKLYQ